MVWLVGDKVTRLVIGLVISSSLVQYPTRALWAALGQDSLFHIASVYPSELGEYRNLCVRFRSRLASQECGGEDSHAVRESTTKTDICRNKCHNVTSSF